MLKNPVCRRTFGRCRSLVALLAAISLPALTAAAALAGAHALAQRAVPATGPGFEGAWAVPAPAVPYAPGGFPPVSAFDCLRFP